MVTRIISASVPNHVLGIENGLEIELRGQDGTLVGTLCVFRHGVEWRAPRKRTGRFLPWKLHPRVFRRYGS